MYINIQPSERSEKMTPKRMPIRPTNFNVTSTPSYSQKAMFHSCRFSIIEKNILTANKPHTFCQLLKNFIELIRSEDPTEFHYDIAKIALASVKKEISNIHAVDMLAREFLNACCVFDEKFQLPMGFAKLIRRDLLAIDYPYTSVVDLSNSIPSIDDHFFTNEGLSIWDYEYIKLLKCFGKEGHNLAQNILKKYNKELCWDASFWFNKNSLNDKSYLLNSPAFIGLAVVLWKDIVKK